VKLQIAWIGKTKMAPVQALTSEYLKRIQRYIPTSSLELGNEAALLKQMEKSASPPFLVLLDSRGKQFTSEELASFIENQKNSGRTALLFAVGGADGFSDAARSVANLQLSLGPMTLAHELARVVLLEQIYRALTILNKHPYHLGH